MVVKGLRVGLTELEILDIFDVIGESVDDSGVNAVLEAEGFGEDERVIARMDGNGGGLLGIELNNHFDWRLTGGRFGSVLNGGLIAEFGVEDFLDDAVGVCLEHDLES